MLGFESPLKKRKISSIETFADLIKSLKTLKPISNKSLFTEQERDYWQDTISDVVRYLNNWEYLNPLVELATLEFNDQDFDEVMDLLFRLDDNITTRILKRNNPDFSNPLAEIIFYTDVNVGNISTKGESVFKILKFLCGFLKPVHLSQMLSEVGYGALGACAVHFAVERRLFKVISFVLEAESLRDTKFVILDRKYNSLVEYLLETNDVEMMRSLPRTMVIKLTMDEEIAYLKFKKRNPNNFRVTALIHEITYTDVEKEILRRCLNGNIQDFLDVFGDDIYSVSLDLWAPAISESKLKTKHKIFDELGETFRVTKSRGIKFLYERVCKSICNQSQVSINQEISFFRRHIAFKVHNLNFKTSDGEFLLISAIKNKNIPLQIIQEIIEAGANVNLCDDRGRTTLEISQDRDDFESLYEVLLTHGAEVNIRSEILKPKCMQILLAAGVNLNFRANGECNSIYLLCEDTNGSQALQFAAQSGNCDVIKRLLELGIYNVHHVNKKAHNALYYARESKNLDAVRIFIELGLNPLPLKELIFSSTQENDDSIESLIDEELLGYIQAYEYLSANLLSKLHLLPPEIAMLLKSHSTTSLANVESVKDSVDYSKDRAISYLLNMNSKEMSKCGDLGV